VPLVGFCKGCAISMALFFCLDVYKLVLSNSNTLNFYLYIRLFNIIYNWIFIYFPYHGGRFYIFYKEFENAPYKQYKHCTIYCMFWYKLPRIFNRIYKLTFMYFRSSDRGYCIFIIWYITHITISSQFFIYFAWHLQINLFHNYILILTQC